MAPFTRESHPLVVLPSDSASPPSTTELRSWPGLVLGPRIDEGVKSPVWRGEIMGEPVAVRRTTRGAASVAWEIALLDKLARAGFVVPTALPTADGRRFADGVVVQHWIDGLPPVSASDWEAVAAELRRLHFVTSGHRQRPGCVVVHELSTARRSVDADLDAMPAAVVDTVTREFAALADVAVAVVHGDPGPSNIRIRADGRVGLVDWDESRVDVVWHDLSDLGVQVLGDADHARARRLSNAWEAANGWQSEPAYARKRLAQND